MWIQLIVILLVAAAWVVFGILRRDEGESAGCLACSEKDSCGSGCGHAESHTHSHFDMHRRV